MQSILVLLLCVVGVAVGVRDVEWESFKSSYGLQYENPTEEALRKKIFHDNKILIDQQNQLFAEGKSTFTMGINQFADMTNQEFRDKMTRRVVSLAKPSVNSLGSVSVSSNDSSVDWRGSGCVPAVKDQGQCGISSVFSTVGSIEFCRCRKIGILTSLSAQCLIDCCSAYGYTQSSNFQCVIDLGGISSSTSYPYTMCTPSSCNYNEADSGASIVSYVSVVSGSESQLKSAVNNAVVATSIDASRLSFQLYTGGIYDDPSCSSTALDHSVLVVGYGTVAPSTDYWLVENSWGSGWGEAGYIRMARNKNNQCGIATDAGYPLC